TGASLSNGGFSHASFRSSDLSNADLASSSFDGADFREADFSRTTLQGADLSNARNLTQRQLDDACGDARTRLPRGLTVRACGPVRLIVRREATKPPLRMNPTMPAPPPEPRYVVSVAR
ncbi:MAG TPA: pentapeptide repeat-containing protein, partial [Sphingomicrobium sp.]